MQIWYPQPFHFADFLASLRTIAIVKVLQTMVES